MREYENPAKTYENRMPQRSYYIPDGKSEYLLLNGQWNFAYFDRDIDVPENIDKWDSVPVPSCWQTLGYETPHYVNFAYPFACDPPYVPDDNSCGVYERDFDIAEKWGKLYFVLEGVSSCAYVYVNGGYVGFTQGSHLQAEFDITDFVHKGKNTLRVKVLKWCCGSYLEDQDFYRHNGIFRDCYILQRPMGHICDTVITAAENAVSVKTDQNADVSLYDAEDNLIGKAWDTKNAVINVTFPVLWNAEKPYLYTVVIERDGEVITQKTAFRTIQISDKLELLINGVSVKLHGVNHHDTHPKNGWCQSDEELMNDLCLMKQLNINCVRTSHYPPTPKFLQMCDQMGFYVILETDLECHGFVSRVAHRGYGYDSEDLDWPCTNPMWQNEFVDRMKRAALRDRNHPCIIMWSLGNESGFGENHAAMSRWLRTLDDGRLIHYEGASVAGDTESVDISSRMYSPIPFVEEYGKDDTKTQPLFLCEYSHAMGNSPGDVYYYNEMFDRYPKLIGGCIWEWADHTVIDADGVQRYGGDYGDVDSNEKSLCCDGVVFSDRSLKAGSFEVKAAYQPMKTELCGDTLKITNRYDFTDLSECEFCYTVECDGEVVLEKHADISVAPHQTAEITVDIPDGLKVRYGAYVNCELRRSDETLAKTQHEIDVPHIVFPKSSAGAEITQDGTDLYFSGDGFRYAFSMHYGTFTSIVTDGKERILTSPLLTAWRAITDNDSKMKQWWGFEYHPQSENYDKPRYKVYDCTVSDNVVTVKGAVSGVSRKPFFVYTMTLSVFADGRIDVALDGNIRENAAWLPRLGFEFTMPQESGDFSYFGFGPYESYCDLHNGSAMGLYHSTAEDEYVNYVRPQEHGNHWNTRMLNIGGLRFEGVGFEFCVSRYSTDAIHRAWHTDELESDGKTHIRIDYKGSGIGSASCGSDLLEPYRLSDKEVHFEFSVTPE